MTLKTLLKRKGKGYASQDVKNLTISQLEHLIANYGYAHSVGREYCHETLVNRLLEMRTNLSEAMDYFDLVREEARQQSNTEAAVMPPTMPIRFNVKY